MMPSDVTREEFETRVGTLEREVEGEKLVTRHIFEQTRLNSADLATIKTQVDSIDRKIDRLDRKVGGLDQKIDGVDHRTNGLADHIRAVRQDVTGLRDDVTGLATTLPTMIADVMRQVLRERGGKP